jgi:hypothetical protein
MSYVCPHIMTKSLVLMLLLAFCPLTRAQNISEGHGIVVLKYNWTSYRPGWDRRLTGGMGPVRDSSGQINPPIMAKGTPPTKLGYLYKTKFANKGQKEVRVVVWEYRFTDRVSHESTAHRFRSVVKLKPRASRELREFSYQQPASVANVNVVGKEPREAFEEEVRIIRVEYADGSVWTAEEPSPEGRAID